MINAVYGKAKTVGNLFPETPESRRLKISFKTH